MSDSVTQQINQYQSDTYYQNLLSYSGDIENNTWVLRDVEFPLSCWTRYLRSSQCSDIKFNMRREIPYLQATMSYFVYYMNTLLTRRSGLNSRFKKRTHCHSFVALNRVSESDFSEWRGTCLLKIPGVGVHAGLRCCANHRGVIQSRGWLPKVEALRYLRHPTSTKQCCCSAVVDYVVDYVC